MPERLSGERFEIPRPGGARIVGETYDPVGRVDPALPMVVLAHGWTLNRTLWSRVIRGLQERLPIRVVAYDQRGHGESVPGSVAPSIRLLGEDLAAVIDECGGRGRLVLCGHSMGGMTVMAYAGLHPADVIARVAGVLLLGTAAADVSRPGWVGKIEMGVMHVAARGPRIPAGVFVTKRHQRHLNFGDDADPRDVALVRKAIAGTKIKDMGSYFTALEGMDERASLAALATVPTTIMVGSKDRLTPPPYAYALHEGIPGSALIEFPGKGHMLGYEATAEVVAQLIAYATP